MSIVSMSDEVDGIFVDSRSPTSRRRSVLEGYPSCRRTLSICLTLLVTCLFAGAISMEFIAPSSPERESNTLDQDSIALIIIYQTNLTDSSSLTSDDRHFIVESLHERLDLVDVYVATSQFVSLSTNGTRKKRDIRTELKSCEHGNTETTGDLIIVQLSSKYPLNHSTVMPHEKIHVSPRLANGQILNVEMSFCSLQQTASMSRSHLAGSSNRQVYRASSHKENGQKKVTVSPCQGGLYPNDDQCVAYQYGPDPIQVIDCHLPKGPFAPLVVLLIHGGFWRSMYNRSIEDAVGNDLLRFNLIVCNLDYRSFGNGGGYPNTFSDVSNGADLLRIIAQEHGFQSDRVIVVGHSAGGQLGGYLTGRFRLRADQPGYSPNPLRPIALVTQAGVNNMWDGCDQAAETGSGAVIDFLGGTYEAYPERYTLSSVAASSNAAVRTRYPSQFLPLQVPIQAITGSADITVPVSQTVTFAEQAISAGDNCTQVIVNGEDHFAHLNISSRSWHKTLTFILSFIP